MTAKSYSPDEQKYELYYLSIDSRQRDLRRFDETPSRYRIDLPDTYHNVVEATLISAEIPKTDFNINENNNIFDFKEVSQVYKT